MKTTADKLHICMIGAQKYMSWRPFFWLSPTHFKPDRKAQRKTQNKEISREITKTVLPFVENSVLI